MDVRPSPTVAADLPGGGDTRLLRARIPAQTTIQPPPRHLPIYHNKAEEVVVLLRRAGLASLVAAVVAVVAREFRPICLPRGLAHTGHWFGRGYGYEHAFFLVPLLSRQIQSAGKHTEGQC
jgi:hypothetical protein